MKYIARTRQTITAWRYEVGVGVPFWVARKCHDLGDGKLTANTIGGPMPIEVGDYVALIDDEQNAVTVVAGDAFQEEYAPLGDQARHAGTFGKFAVFRPYESHDGGVAWTVQRLSSTDDPDEFGDQIAEFMLEEDARLFAATLAGAGQSDTGLMVVAEQQIDWIASKLETSREVGRLALYSVLRSVLPPAPTTAPQTKQETP